jgi:hypothetical protein
MEKKVRESLGSTHIYHDNDGGEKQWPATAMISAILVSGVLHFTLARRSTAVMREPTRLMATKKTKLEI